MPAYTVKAPESAGRTLVGDGDVQIVFAATATAAKEIAASKYDGDGTLWAGATVTEIVAATDFEGWKFDILICGGTGADDTLPAAFSYTGTATNNTIDEIAAQLVILLNAHDDIAGAAYNATTNTLTVAETTDGLGAQKLIVKITPPGGKSEIPSLVGTITHQGSASAALTVVLPADNAVLPASVMTAKSV